MDEDMKALVGALKDAVTNTYTDGKTGRTTDNKWLFGKLLDPGTHCLKCRSELVKGKCYNIQCGEMDPAAKRKVMEKKEMILSLPEAKKLQKANQEKAREAMEKAEANLSPEEAAALAK